MRIENIFTEFMSLYYKESGEKPNYLKDIPISSGVIARKTELGCTIYYLTTGSYIRIPWEFMDLFSSFNTYSGDRVINLKSDNQIEEFIQQFVRFICYLEYQNSDMIIQTFNNILDLRTSDFREWYKNKFNKKLRAIEFFSPNKTFEI